MGYTNDLVHTFPLQGELIVLVLVFPQYEFSKMELPQGELVALVFPLRGELVVLVVLAQRAKEA